ncbi:RNA exonuclease ngl2 [Dimargaris verticillata]|uniref:RNA exonuclease ngl2 n=1 Tax=Dimargaris verticillata TaxID=2761393 RepID=A0A9W8BCC0_9FUNG|nr:RNA exonuclease ngl2 [Dimargaris verticillata]
MDDSKDTSPKAFVKRQWQTVPASTDSEPEAPALRFTIMTYNVMAPSLGKHSWLPNSTPRNLNGKTRRNRIIGEINHHRPDIICLQEVDDEKDFKPFYRPRLRKLHYRYRHKQPRVKNHGCCIAWDMRKWRLLDFESVVFNVHSHTQGIVEWYLTETGQALEDLSIDPAHTLMVDDLNQMWSSHNVNIATFAVLHHVGAADQAWFEYRDARNELLKQQRAVQRLMRRAKRDGLEEDPKLVASNEKLAILAGSRMPQPDQNFESIIVITCHLLWSPNAHFERLIQVMLVLRRVCHYNRNLRLPVVFAGDFNAAPIDPLYKGMVNQPLDATDCDVLLCSMEDYVQARFSHRYWGVPLPDSLFYYIPEQARKKYVAALIDQLKGAIRFNSAYNQPGLHPPPLDGEPTEHDEPPYTTYCQFVGTLDYIFYTADPQSIVAESPLAAKFPGRNRIILNRPVGDMDTEPLAPVDPWWKQCRPTKILEIPAPSTLEPGIPNARFGSDHLCLLTELKITHA